MGKARVPCANFPKPRSVRPDSLMVPLRIFAVENLTGLTATEVYGVSEKPH